MSDKKNENAINGFDPIPALRHGKSFLDRKGTRLLCGTKLFTGENRIEESWYPIEDGEITEHVLGYSLAPSYSSVQLRVIQRRGIKKGFGVEAKED